MRDGEKGLFHDPHPPSVKVPPLPEGEGSLLDDGFFDFSFGSAQNDRLREIRGRVKVFLEKLTKNDSVALCIGPLIKFLTSYADFLIDPLVHFFEQPILKHSIGENPLGEIVFIFNGNI